MTLEHNPLAPSGSSAADADARGLASAHGAWAAAIASFSVVLAMAGWVTSTGVVLALILGMAPGVVGMVWLTRATAPRAPLVLIGLWVVCTVLAVILTGGAGGPLAAWTLAPIAVAAAFDRPGLMSKAATAALTAAALAALLPAIGLAGMPPELGKSALGALALTTTAASLGAGLILHRRRGRTTQRGLSQEIALREDLLAGQPHLLLMTDPSGKVSLYGGAAPAGVILARLLEHGLSALVSDTDRPTLYEALGIAVQSGEAQLVFAPVSAPQAWLALDLKSRGDGRIAGILRDASADKAAVDAAENARGEAESLATGRARFLASMSHELRTPLNAIMGFSDIMRNRMFGDLSGKYGEYAELIHDSGSHLLDLINDVLDMSKIEAQRYDLRREILDAREPISAALRIVRLQADEAKISLRASLPSTPMEADADRRAMKQIVLNLVSNALKFTPEGGAVTVSLNGHQTMLELTVADTGSGIASEDLARLGRPYEQAGDSDRRAMGTGLGLSLVRAFAELHGGEMIIESTLGQGTSVTVRMPVLLPVEAEPPKPNGSNVVFFNPNR